MRTLENPVIRPVIWLGSSKKRIQKFPVQAQKLIGDQLQLIQFGGMPHDAKYLRGIGAGVLEIAIRHNKESYRCIQAVQLGAEIYVLHAFHKKSHKGIQTPHKDIAVIKQRYKEAQKLANDEQSRQN